MQPEDWQYYSLIYQSAAALRIVAQVCKGTSFQVICWQILSPVQLLVSQDTTPFCCVYR